MYYVYIRFTSKPPVEVYPIYIVSDSNSNTVTQSCDGRVRSGVVAAATITMLIVGIIIGVIVGLVVCVCVQHFKSRKFTPSSNNPKEEGRYERHFDEAGDDSVDLKDPPSSL